MAKRKFIIAEPRFKIVNRCIFCSDVIDDDEVLCNRCEAKQKRGSRLR